MSTCTKKYFSKAALDLLYERLEFPSRFPRSFESNRGKWFDRLFSKSTDVQENNPKSVEMATMKGLDP